MTARSGNGIVKMKTAALAFLYAAHLFAAQLFAAEVPAGTELSIRLTDKVASETTTGGPEGTLVEGFA